MQSKIINGNDDTINIVDTSVFSYAGNDIFELDPDKPDTPPIVKNLSYIQNNLANKRIMRRNNL